MSKNFNFLLLGMSGAGKTEYAHRTYQINVTSQASTILFNVFSSILQNLFKEEDQEEIGELYLRGERADASLWDFSGQRNEIGVVGRYLDEMDGIIYVIDGAKPVTKETIKWYETLDKEITIEYNRIGKTKPPVTLYVSKCMKKSSKVNLDSALTGNYQLIKINDKPYSFEELLIEDSETNELPRINDYLKLLKNKTIDDYLSLTNEFVETFEEVNYSELGRLLKLSQDLNATLFIGDSIGPNPPEIKPEVYLIKTFDKLLEIPVLTSIHALMTVNIILPILKKEGKGGRKIRSLEEPLVEQCMECGLV